VLERRPSGGIWQGGGAVAASKDGVVAVPVKLQASTEYRLTSGTLHSGTVRLSLAPALRLLRAADAAELRGRVKPALTGSVVVVERQTASGWAAAGRSSVDAKGAFVARLAVKPGSYRARLPAGRGFAAGMSPVLQVQ
jgi:hypothetical protein